MAAIGAAEERADDDLVARLREGDRAAVEQAYVAHGAPGAPEFSSKTMGWATVRIVCHIVPPPGHS